MSPGWNLSDALEGRAVSSGSVFSKSLRSFVIHDQVPEGTFRRLVDVGCGDSPYRNVFGEVSYFGVDRSDGGAPEVVRGDASALPVASASADAVLCTEVIEHVQDERALAAELARVAAPGATLVLSSPFVHGLHEQPYDFRRLTSIGLVSTLTSVGWEVDEVAAIGGSVVVSVDACVKWVDSQLRRIARRVSRPGSRVHSVLTTPSRWVQVRLAGLVLRRSRFLGPIDPFRPVPRLTLGYVVRATRQARDVTAATSGTPRRTGEPAD